MLYAEAVAGLAESLEPLLGFGKCREPVAQGCTLVRRRAGSAALMHASVLRVIRRGFVGGPSPETEALAAARNATVQGVAAAD
jgi:hypothetical protein